MKEYFFISLLLAFAVCLHAQNRNLTIEQRAKYADAIFEGKVINQESFWNNDKTRIYTEHTIQVSKSFKGESQSVIHLITQGGILDDYFQTISHSIGLQLNSEGVFFCKSYTLPQIKRAVF